MAFLDNSGDIILDAVLTDLGRKRLAEGEFRITQFALGDDEIDYSLYNKNHPSGSAYYDLEILQTPVFEAFTRENSNINHGLLSLRDDLLYLPSMKLNEKSQKVTSNLVQTNKIVYMAVNGETHSKLLQDAGLTINQAANEAARNQAFVFETGLDNNNDPAGTGDNRLSYLVSPGLLDREFTLKCDGRFLTSVFPIAKASSGADIGGFPAGDPGSGGSSIFRFLPNDDQAQIQLTPLGNPLSPTAQSTGMENHRMYVLPSIENLVFDQGTRSTSATDVSAINGPRGMVTAFNLGVAADLKVGKTASTPAKYSLYGKTTQSAANAGLTTVTGTAQYDFLDTVVYLNGNTTGVSAQTIVRIIRLVTD
jgi:hypothetical protein